MKNRRVLASALWLSIVACGGSESTTPHETSTPSWSGEYVMTTYNGSRMPALLSSGSMVDTGTAMLWPSGYYEIYARMSSGTHQYFSIIFDPGYWSSTGDALQLKGSRLRSLTQQSGGFSAIELDVNANTQTLEFRRVGDAPPPPTRQFNADTPPSYSGTVSVTGSGANTVIVAALVVKNPDVISRTVGFNGVCDVTMWLSTDSTDIRTNVFTTYPGGPCADLPIDTIPPGGTKTHQVTVHGSDLLGLLGKPPAPVRYYAWVRQFTSLPNADVKVGLGWITLTP